MENYEHKLLKRQRLLIAIIGILAFTTFISIVYAFVQQGIAHENALRAQAYAVEARKNATKAIEQALIAKKLTEEAERQQQRAEDALRKNTTK